MNAPDTGYYEPYVNAVTDEAGHPQPAAGLLTVYGRLNYRKAADGKEHSDKGCV